MYVCMYVCMYVGLHVGMYVWPSLVTWCTPEGEVFTLHYA